MDMKDPPEGNATDLASLLGISPRKVRLLTEKNIMVKIRRGIYDLRKSIRGYYLSVLTPDPESPDMRPEARPDTVSSSELADLLGLSSRWIQKLTADGVITKSENGYSLSKSVQQYCDYLRNGAKSNQPELDAANLRLVQAKADTAEISVSILLGDTVRLDMVEKVWGNLVTIFRSRVLAMPWKLAPVLAKMDDPAEIEAAMMEEVKDGLDELSAFDPEEVIDRSVPEDTGDDGPAADPDGVGMGGREQETFQ